MLIISIIILFLIFFLPVLMWKMDYPVTGALVLTNTAVFIIQWGYMLTIGDTRGVFNDLGFRADYLTTGSHPWTIVSNLFIHGGFLHILGNMLFLALLGMPFEDRIGRKRFAIIYFGTGIFANLFDASITLFLHGAGSEAAMTIGVGASGAIFGIMGAFAILYPRDEIPMILGPLFLQRVPVYIAALGYAFFEIFAASVSPQDHIGHIAHVGGFISGLVFAPLIVRDVKRAPDKMNYSGLDELFRNSLNDGLRNAVKKLRATTIPEVRMAWWEHILSKAKCPVCSAPLSDSGHGLVCNKCGYSLDLRAKRKKEQKERI